MSSYGDNSIRKIGYVILAILFLSDLAYSFRQHYATPLDGDVVESVLPLPEFEKVLESPLGLNAILDQESYPNPNRFFMHWPMKQFLGNMPIFLQNFFDPIQSVYMSIGIAKTSMQLIIIILLASIINGGFKLQSIDFILCCVILSALFQTHGYRVKIGIIDRSITYAFSYALPLIYLLIFYLPLFIGGVQKKLQDQPNWIFLVMFPLGMVVCLSGPLNPAIVLVTTMLIVMSQLMSIPRKGFKLWFHNLLSTKNPSLKVFLLYLLPVSLFAVYSLVLGQNNSNQNLYPYSLLDSYKELPIGLFKYLTSKIAIPLLILTILLNHYIVKTKSDDSIGSRLWSYATWFLVFSIIYIVLLPLGGYRDYRPHIIRYDTLLPITIGIFILFGSTTISTLNTVTGPKKAVYASFIVIVLSVFTISDEPKFHEHEQEMRGLYKISNSSADTVQLDSGTTVLSWYPILKPSNSKWNAELLYKWKIAPTPKLYYSKQE
jgi:hypothetical protein